MTTPLNDLTRDAHEVAEAFADGQGMDALEVIFGGNYYEPAALARLLRAAATILEKQ
jgi:hypothetical protein